MPAPPKRQSVHAWAAELEAMQDSQRKIQLWTILRWLRRYDDPWVRRILQATRTGDMKVCLLTDSDWAYIGAAPRSIGMWMPGTKTVILRSSHSASELGIVLVHEAAHCLRHCGEVAAFVQQLRFLRRHRIRNSPADLQLLQQITAPENRGPDRLVKLIAALRTQYPRERLFLDEGTHGRIGPSEWNRLRGHFAAAEKMIGL